MRGPRLRWVLAGMGAAALLAAGLVTLDRLTAPAPVDSCVARVGSSTVRLEPDQAKYASLIVATAVRRGLPVRASNIALAAALQESGLRNLDHGDRDSLGLFQQRPSQGWGTAEEVRDPVHAANAFYDALERVPGYRELPIGVAAQRVQASAYPDAYADHESDARILGSALTGWKAESFTCTVHRAPDLPEEAADDNGLTRRAAAVRRELVRAFGGDHLRGFGPVDESDGRQRNEAHAHGRAIDVSVGPADKESRERGWAVASFLVANARRLGITVISFDDRIWEAGEHSTRGWQDYRPPDGARGDAAARERRTRVHVEVA